MLTFRVGYRDVFGTDLHHDLVEGGEAISVTAENRQVSFTCVILPKCFDVSTRIVYSCCARTFNEFKHILYP